MPSGHEWNAPWIPFEFRVTMPHHLAQGDEQSGAYIREGKSYHRVWVHAIHEGTKTRFWQGDQSTATQDGATTAEIELFPGEEFAQQENEQNPQPIDITRTLTNPLPPQASYTAAATPWTGGNAQDDSESFFRGVHGLPANERKLAARGLTISFLVEKCAAPVRFLGWGGEFGAGVHNIYKPDPTYPFPNP